MSDILDKIHDLAHHAVNLVTGDITKSDPPKPPYTGVDASQHLGSGLAKKGADAISGRQKQIDSAVDDMS